MYVMLPGLFSAGVRPHTWRVSAYKHDALLPSNARRVAHSNGLTEIFAVMRQLGLLVSRPACEPESLQQAWEDTVRHRGGLQRLPLPISIGAGFSVNDLTTDELTLAAAQLRARGDDRG